MTLALANTFRPTVRDWTKVLPLEQAAGRLGVSADTLRRRCDAELAARGLAFFARPERGGKSQWFVHTSVDPCLQPGIIGDLNRDSDLSAFTAKQRDAAYQRRNCVLLMMELERTRLSSADIAARVIAHAATLKPPLKVGPRQLYRWRSVYCRPSDLVKLVDQRGGDRRSQGDDAAWTYFQQHFLNDHKPTVRNVWKLTGREAKVQGWKWCTYPSCHGQFKKRIPLNEQVKIREPAVYRKSLQPWIEQDPERSKAGECWVGDHKQLDLLCLYRGQRIRPWLTCWMDWRTRRVVGYVLSASPSSQTILAAFRAAALNDDIGLPRQVWIDNGKDYCAWVFHNTTKHERRVSFPVNEAAAGGIFDGLGIKAHFSLAYSPNGKARLERYFGNFTSFARHFPTYTGTSVADKPESLAGVLRSGKNIPTFGEVERRVRDFIDGYNENSDHRMGEEGDMLDEGERLSPAEAYRRWARDKRLVANKADLDLFLEMPVKTFTVGRNGIRAVIRGMAVRYGQHDPALSALKAVHKADRAKLRIAYDPNDVRTIKVYRADLSLICTVAMNARGGFSSDPIHADRLGELLAEQRRTNRAKVLVKKNAFMTVLSNEEQIALANADKPKPPTPPADSMRLVPLPNDGASKVLERERVRRAAGAENHTPATTSTADLMRQYHAAPKRKSFLEQFAEDLD